MWPVFGVLVGTICALTSGFVLPSDTPPLIALYLPVVAGGWAGGFLGRKQGWIVGLLVGCLNLIVGLGGLVFMVVLPHHLPINAGLIDVSTLPTILVCSVAGYMGDRCYHRCPVQLRLWPPRLSIGQEVGDEERQSRALRQNR